MLLLLLFMPLLSAALVLLNAYTLKRTGIKNALFYFKCDGESWIAETAWINDFTGQVHKIITSSNWQDGVISVLNNHETIYHTKQPFYDRPNLQRFHRTARNRFFNQTKLRSLIELKRAVVFSNKISPRQLQQQ